MKNLFVLFVTLFSLSPVLFSQVIEKSLNFSFLDRDRVYIPHSGVYDIGQGEHTFEAIIKLDESDVNLQDIHPNARFDDGILTILTTKTVFDPQNNDNPDYFDDNNFNGYTFGVTQRGFLTLAYANQRIEDDKVNLIDGKTHHVAVKRRIVLFSIDQSPSNSLAGIHTNVIEFFVDGVMVSSFRNVITQVGRDPVRNLRGGDLFIGFNTDYSFGGYPFNGCIQEVRLWNRELSELEILSNSSGQLNGSEQGLIGYWKLDEKGSSQIVLDHSLTKNNGFLGNSALEEVIDPVFLEGCGTCSKVNYYLDADGDSFGDINNLIESCDSIAGYVLNSEDCDDTNPLINPGAIEICDGMDNNCDGLIDNNVEINITQSMGICPVVPSQITLSIDAPTAGSRYNWSYSGSNGYVQNLGTSVNFQTWGSFDGGSIEVQEIGGCGLTGVIELTILEDEVCCENVNADFSTNFLCSGNGIAGWAASYWPTNDYEWTLNSEVVSSSSNLNNNSLMPGDNVLSLKVSANGFCERTVEKVIVVDEDAVVISQEGGEICDDQIEVLLVSNLIDMTDEGEPIHINWSVNNGYISQNLGDSAIVTLDPSFLQIGSTLEGALGYTDRNGCYKRIDFFGGQVVSCEDAELMIFPNPFGVETILRIENTQDLTGTVKVSTAWGMELTTIEFETNEDVIIGSNLNPGTYFLEIIIDDMVFFERIVKE